MQKIKVLIAEDDHSLARVISEKFIQEGFEVFNAYNGIECVEVALKENPDIVLLDIIMPKLDGLRALKEIRKDENWGKKVPVIVLSNLSSADEVQRASEDGVYDYLVKSDWKLEEVVERVKARLEIK